MGLGPSLRRWPERTSQSGNAFCFAFLRRFLT
jgi:hypothetical protein